MPTVRARARALLARRGVLVIAHRGASADAPENTLPAFERALEAGADLVELDVHASRDGVPVVFHDATLDRTTDARARWGGERLPLAAHTAEVLQTLDAGAWFGAAFAGTRIPTLEQALDCIQPRALTLIERKEGTAQALVELLRARGALEDVIVQSFDWDFLAEVHRRAPEVTLGALGSEALDAAHLARARAAGAAVVGWRQADLDEAAIGAAHAHGLQVWAYTVNDLERARALAAWGVDGLISDVPAAIRAGLAAGGAAPRR